MIFSIYVLREDRTKAFFDVELGMRDFLNSNDNENITLTDPSYRRLHGPIDKTLREDYDCVGVFEVADKVVVFSCPTLTKDPLEYGVSLGVSIFFGDLSLKASDILNAFTDKDTSMTAPIECLWKLDT